MSIGKRERRSTEFFEEATAVGSGAGSSGDAKPRFEFALGRGTPLSQAPNWVAPGSRANKKEAEALELALEPLHRALYGRPGKTGERRQALSGYRGFPEDQKTVMKAKVTTWKKEQLKDLVQAVGGTGIHVSGAVASLADDVLKFLESPTFPKTKPQSSADKALAATPRPKKTERNEAEDGPEAPELSSPAKKARTEPAAEATESNKTKRPATRPPVKSIHVLKSATGPSSHRTDAVCVQVYKRVLMMTAEERNTLSIKGLRKAIGDALHMNDGAMKEYSDVIKQTAAECVRALRLEGERVLQSAAADAGAAAKVVNVEDDTNGGSASPVVAEKSNVALSPSPQKSTLLVDSE